MASLKTAKSSVCDKKKQKDPFAPPKSRLHSACRKLWLWSPNRKEAMARARVGRGIYLCAGCGSYYARGIITVDHIEKVGDLFAPGYFSRLFCHPDGLQVLCEGCHEKKTKQERSRK